MLVLLCYPHVFVFFFFKQKTAYERRISDWSSDVCSSDLRVPELVSQAFHRAMSGRPGPVAVALPEDMLRDMTEAADAAPYQVARPGADPADMARLRDLLAGATRPLMVLGGAGWSREPCRPAERRVGNEGGTTWRCMLSPHPRNKTHLATLPCT